MLEKLDSIIANDDDETHTKVRYVENIKLVIDRLMAEIKRDEENDYYEHFLFNIQEALVKTDYLLNKAEVVISEEDFIDIIEDLIEIENMIYEEVNDIDVISINIVAIANNYLENESEIILDGISISVEGDSVAAVVDFSDIEKDVVRMVEKKKLIETKLKDLSNEAYSDLTAKLTIALPKQDGEILNRRIEIRAGLIEKIKEKGMEAVTFDMGHNSISINEQFFSELRESSVVEIVSNVVDGEKLSTSNDLQTFDKLEKIEIKVLVDGEQVTEFDVPLEITFDVSNLDTDNMNLEELKALTVFRFNEEALEWENVGGWFDPITKTVRVFRLNLSKYSVMVSNKSFSNINNSRAENEINALLGKGIIKNDEIDLDEEISRGEFTAWLLRTYGLTDNSAEIAFDDVTRDNSFFTEINTAFQLGLVNGRGEGKFDPSAKLTQKEMGILIKRASSLYGKLNNAVLAGDILDDDVNRNNNGILAFLNAAVFSVDTNRLEGTLGLISRERAAATIFALGTTR